MDKKLLNFSLFFFFLIALVGTYIRGAMYFGFSLNETYKHLVHSHSHTAFQGWIYTVLMLLSCIAYLPSDVIKRGRYQLQFYLTCIIVGGVFVSFSLQGYGLYSILFSSLFQLSNYWYMYRFYKDSKPSSLDKKPVGLSFVHVGLFLGLLSTFAPWFVGFLSAKGLAKSELYHATIYFFLHFQYNGWFLFTLLGLTLKVLSNKGILIPSTLEKKALIILSIATVLLYGHSVLNMQYAPYFLPGVIVGILLQWWAFILLAKPLYMNKNKLFSFQNLSLIVFLLWAVSLILKISLQTLSVLPALHSYAFESRPIIMAYMHLSLIGVLSINMIFNLLSSKLLNESVYLKDALGIILVGFIISEISLILFSSSLLWVFIGSFAMAFGIGMLMVIQLSTSMKKAIT